MLFVNDTFLHFAFSLFRNGDELVLPGQLFWLLPGEPNLWRPMAPKAPTSPLKSAAKAMVAPKAKAEPKAGKLLFFRLVGLVVGLVVCFLVLSYMSFTNRS